MPSDEPHDTDEEESADEPRVTDEEDSERRAETDEDEPEESDAAEESAGESATIGADPARDVFSAVESGPDDTNDERETGTDEAPEATETAEATETDVGTEAETEPEAGSDADASGMVFCRQCGERIAETAPTCPNCGAPQDREGGGRKEKDPGIAALASLIVPGAGQLYNGQFVRGAVAFVGVGLADLLLVVVALVLSIILIGPLFLLLIPVVHILVAYDAYDQAKRINSGEIDPDA